MLRIEEPWHTIEFGNRRDSEPTGTIRIHSPQFYRSVVQGSLAAAESYLDGTWDSPNLVDVLRVMARNQAALQSMDGPFTWLRKPLDWCLRWTNRNSQAGSRRNIAAHYDLGNDFFQLLLDESMTYSSGIFVSDHSSMAEASREKYDRVCRKLQLDRHHRVVEIGTGWGGFAIHAATEYGCHVTTTTISEQQFEYARGRIKSLGLADRIDLQLCDYRNLSGQYDKLVSIEMIEAVGHEFLEAYFQKCSDLLTEYGQMVLQAITIPDQRYESYRRSIDFIQKHIFPGGCLPSVRRILQCVSVATDLNLIHLEDFAAHYARTLQHWRDSFRANLEAVKATGKDDWFLRAWEYYFAYCEAGFAERQIGVSQMLLSKPDSRLDCV